MEMLQEFPRWYQSVDLEHDAAKLKSRWEGVAELNSGIDTPMLDLLVDLATHREVSRDTEPFERFVSVFKNHDPYFDAEDASQEVALLAGAALTVVLTGPAKDEYPIDAAMRVSAALHDGGVSAVTAIDLNGRAREALARLGAAVRDRSDTLALRPLPKTNVSFEQALMDAPGFSDPEQIKSSTAIMAGVIVAAIDTAAKRARADLKAVKDHLEVKDEELDMLWWAFNEQSISLGKPFSKLKDGERALVGAAELADRTRMEPGPVSAHALLMRTGAKPRAKVATTEAVNACNEAWLKAMVHDDANNHTPIHMAISKRVEAGKPGAWETLWHSAMRIEDGFSMTEADIAFLFYVERLLLNRMEAARE